MQRPKKHLQETNDKVREGENISVCVVNACPSESHTEGLEQHSNQGEVRTNGALLGGFMLMPVCTVLFQSNAMFKYIKNTL